MGNHPKLRWKDAAMKGKLKTLLGSVLTGKPGLAEKIGLAGISETDESVDDESAEILTVSLERKSLKTLEGRTL